MEQRLINSSKALRTLRKTTALLQIALADANSKQAMQPAAKGIWDVREIVRHLAEYELVLQERIQLLITEEMPMLPSIENQHITDTPDTDQDTATLVREFFIRRTQLLTLLEGLNIDQWSREGRHPQQGLGSLLEVALNGALHDIDHLDQLMELVTPAD